MLLIILENSIDIFQKQINRATDENKSLWTETLTVIYAVSFSCLSNKLIQVTFQQETDLRQIDVHVYVYICGGECKAIMNHSQNDDKYETDTLYAGCVQAQYWVWDTCV